MKIILRKSENIDWFSRIFENLFEYPESGTNLPLNRQAGGTVKGALKTQYRIAGKLHSTGAKAVCYINVGTWENWRPDAKQFPSSVLGRTNGWLGERWLYIRQTNVLAICKDKGFDAIEADSVNDRNLNVRATLELSDQRVAFLGSVL